MAQIQAAITPSPAGHYASVVEAAFDEECARINSLIAGRAQGLASAEQSLSRGRRRHLAQRLVEATRLSSQALLTHSQGNHRMAFLMLGWAEAKLNNS